MLVPGVSPSSQASPPSLTTGSTCLRAVPSCGHTELACKFKCEPQPPIIIISLYRQRCRGGALAGREEGSQAPPEPPRDCKAPAASSWARERPRLRAAPAPRSPRGQRRGPVAPREPGSPARVPPLTGISPAERGRRARKEHCSPIKQLTGERMGRPPPLWLPESDAVGKVAGTKIPFSLCLPSLSTVCNKRIYG